MIRARTLATGLLLFATACQPVLDDEGVTEDALGRVPGSVRVNGRSYDVETEYLPRVVQCENPAAPPEAMRAQAIAARTYLTYRTRGQTHPSIADGQSEQVFSCTSNGNGRNVPQAVKDAVASTRGQILTYQNKVIAGFFVAGASRNNAQCKAGSDPTHTERYITINAGLSGSAIHRSRIGSMSSPDNRGAMGQNLANCLALREGYIASQLLAYFYGADIEIRGEGTPPPVPSPREDDPILSPPDDPTTQQPTPTTPADPSDPNDPVLQCKATTPFTCNSFTLARATRTGECVQSQTDQLYYQCDAQGQWRLGVDLDTFQGQVGPCTCITPLGQSTRTLQ